MIIDRSFNLASLMNVYIGKDVVQQQAISWNPDDPNRMAMQLPGETAVLPNRASLGSYVVASDVSLVGGEPLKNLIARSWRKVGLGLKAYSCRTVTRLGAFS